MGPPPLVSTLTLAPVGSAILIALGRKVYAIEDGKSKPLLWKVVSSVVSQLFAMQLTRILAVSAPPEEQAFKRLALWIIMHFFICGWLYTFHVYTESKYTKRIFWHAPCDALAWVVFGLANSFSEAALPVGATEDIVSMGAVVLLVQFLVFYFIWIVPRAMKIGFPDASNVAGSELLLGVHGDRGGTLESQMRKPSAHGEQVGKWLEDCDSICWWGAGYTTAFSALRMFWLHFGENPDCTMAFDDACSWQGHCDFWCRATAAFLIATVLTAPKLLELKQDPGFKNVVASILLTALTTATAMSVMWTLRAGVYSWVCEIVSDLCSEVFLMLMVAYVSTAIAILSAFAMPRLVALSKENHMNPSVLMMLQYLHESLADMAALSWVLVFLVGIDNTAFDSSVVHKDTVPLLLIMFLVPLYVYLITPPRRPPINPTGTSPQQLINDTPELVIDMEVKVKPSISDSALKDLFLETIEELSNCSRDFGPSFSVTPKEPRSAAVDPATVHLHYVLTPIREAEKIAKDVRALGATTFQRKTIDKAISDRVSPEQTTVVVVPMAEPTDPPSPTPVGPPLRDFVVGVYGILCLQIATVVGVCIAIALNDNWHPNVLFSQLAAATVVVLCLLFYYKDKTTSFGFTWYPNCCLLVMFTLLLAFDLNAALRFYTGKQTHTQTNNMLILSLLFSAILILVLFLAKLFGTVDPKKMSVVCFAISYAVFQAEELFLPALVVKVFSDSHYSTFVISMIITLGLSRFVADDVKKLSAVHPLPSGGPATWKDAVSATVDIYFDVLNLLFFLTPWEVR